MPTAQPLLLGRRARRFDDADSIDVVTRPFIRGLVDDRRRRFLDRSPAERQAVAVLLADRFAAETEGEPDDGRGFLERLVDWLADPENREKLREIIAWFMSILEMLSGVPS